MIEAEVEVTAHYRVKASSEEEARSLYEEGKCSEPEYSWDFADSRITSIRAED